MKGAHEARALYFTAPGHVELRREPLSSPAAGQAVVRTRLSGISAGTELLIYHGLAPAGIEADPVLPALAGELAFPLKYGYACVGEVAEVGPDVDTAWLGRPVFAFHPHQSRFVASIEELIPLPPGLEPEDAVFLPNLETAVGLVHDARPLLGERVAVMGQGVVGLLTTALLAQMSPGRLVTADPVRRRRQASIECGAHAAIDPTADDAAGRLLEALEVVAEDSGADLVFELSGNPEALNLAIAVTGYDGRVLIGSWYGRKPTAVDLGGRFHRSRIRLIGSQVSTLAPSLRGRWTKARRLALASARLPELRPSRFVTHRIPFAEAAEAYHLLDRSREDALQVILIYPEES